MKLKDINKGDILCIRQWDDMVDEFGLSKYGLEVAGYLFLPEMMHLCGELFTVDKIYEDRITSVERIERPWYITYGMLEPYVELEDVRDDDFERIIGG